MNQERIFQILVAPHVSEKAAALAETSNQYVFKVAVNATKAEVRKSVEQLFKVKVEAVQTLKVKGKLKRNKHGQSAKPTWKKAYVRLERGQEIDLAVAE